MAISHGRFLCEIAERGVEKRRHDRPPCVSVNRHRYTAEGRPRHSCAEELATAIGDRCSALRTPLKDGGKCILEVASQARRRKHISSSFPPTKSRTATRALMSWHVWDARVWMRRFPGAAGGPEVGVLQPNTRHYQWVPTEAC